MVPELCPNSTSSGWAPETNMSNFILYLFVSFFLLFFSLTSSSYNIRFIVMDLLTLSPSTLFPGLLSFVIPQPIYKCALIV
jgi:hypothetical protein